MVVRLGVLAPGSSVALIEFEASVGPSQLIIARRDFRPGSGLRSGERLFTKCKGATADETETLSVVETGGYIAPVAILRVAPGKPSAEVLR